MNEMTLRQLCQCKQMFSDMALSLRAKTLVEVYWDSVFLRVEVPGLNINPVALLSAEGLNPTALVNGMSALMDTAHDYRGNTRVFPVARPSLRSIDGGKA